MDSRNKPADEEGRTGHFPMKAREPVKALVGRAATSNLQSNRVPQITPCPVFHRDYFDPYRPHQIVWNYGDTALN
jgi:hypothetical protein